MARKITARNLNVIFLIKIQTIGNLQCQLDDRFLQNWGNDLSNRLGCQLEEKRGYELRAADGTQNQYIIANEYTTILSNKFEAPYSNEKRR